ncbi:hypothetical protein PUNSTDRAFT_76828, partial [Punctularia strigosozonata HHB-11173 SS5]
DCAADYIVSSYIPSITIQRKAQEQLQLSVHEHHKALLVAESNALGFGALPHASAEVELIHNVLPKSVRVIDAVNEAVDMEGTIKQFFDASIVHMACHGRQDKDDPLSSGFILRNGILKISDLMGLKIPNASFAYLSACQSATGDDMLPDEGLHLAAAMMFVGFPSVIGTMWPMNDEDGPVVAETVYKAMFKDGSGTIDYDAIPRALHTAARRLREEGAHPSRWATYIHLGV